MEETILICGITRTGTSLTMQMLDMGGLPVIGDYPGYEPNEGSPFYMDKDYIPANTGKIIKLVDPHIAQERGIRFDNCKVIYLSRDKMQQEKSCLKMGAMLFEKEPDYTPSTVLKMMNCLKRDSKICQEIFRRNPLMLYSFEDILRDPADFLMAIENFLSIFSACLLPADPPACCLLKVSRSTIISSYVISPRSWACTISCICSPKVGTITTSRAFASSIASDRSTANSWSRRRERSLMPKLKNPRVVYLTF